MLADAVFNQDIPDDPDLLANEIARVAAVLDVSAHRLLTCIRRFDDSEEWGHQGAVSCAHWLSWRIGLDLCTAREKVRVARSLGTLPKIDEALSRGVLSYAKVRAMTRVATPENEEQLLEIALLTTGGQLERVCRKFRKVVTLTEDGEYLDDRRFVRAEVLESGLVRITAVLQADEAALVLKAIESARLAPVGAPECVSAETPTSARPPAPLPAADALVKVAESFLTHGETSGHSGDRTQLVVHLDQDVIGAQGTLAATLDDGTRISAETFRRLACDARVLPFAQGGQSSVDVGRRTRTIPPPLRRALWARDGGCRFPGCTHRIYVHAHHIQHWLHGGATSAENLVLLCSSHHRLHHEGGFAVERTPTGDLVFRDRRGRTIDPHQQPDDGRWILDVMTRWREEHDEETNYPQWDGEPVDYDAAVTALLG